MGVRRSRRGGRGGLGGTSFLETGLARHADWHQPDAPRPEEERESARQRARPPPHAHTHTRTGRRALTSPNLRQGGGEDVRARLASAVHPRDGMTRPANWPADSAPNALSKLARTAPAKVATRRCVRARDAQRKAHLAHTLHSLPCVGKRRPAVLRPKAPAPSCCPELSVASDGDEALFSLASSEPPASPSVQRRSLASQPASHRSFVRGRP
ncbi:hypothetical protein SRHO_G00234820 [Serrasalmus rhombeus]